MFLTLTVSACSNSTNTSVQFETVWKKSLPETGLSGVCVQNGLIFFTVNDLGYMKLGKKFINCGNIKGKCYDLDGNFKWEIKLMGQKKMKVLDCWLDATAVTPVANDKYVWFLNIVGELVCCDHKGNVIWRKNYPTNAGITPSKLILYKNKLIVSLPSGENAGKYHLYRLQGVCVFSTTGNMK